MEIGEALMQKREAIVHAHMAAENRGDFAAALDLFAHARYELYGGGEVFDGHSQVSQYLKSSRAAFPDQRNEIAAWHHSDDAMIVEYWLTGTHKGPFAGMAPTGRVFRVRASAFYQFDGARLTGLRRYFDSGAIQRQLTG